jgi:ubiquitin-conjugating enzyme E2 D/E
MNNKRLIKEFTDCQTYIEADKKTKNVYGCVKKVELINNNIYHWEAIITGPIDSPFKDGIFLLDLEFPKEFPFKPPKVIFKTPVFHPNINSQGIICLDILKGSWSPALTIQKVLLSITSLLSDPNPNDPLDTDAANLYKNNKDLYNKKVIEMIKK